MAKGSKNPMLGDEKAPSETPGNNSLSGKNQNEHGNEVGYVGGGSMDIESDGWTSGPSDISGGH
jgi:hypothetical protein